MTLPPASRERAFLTASQPADFIKKASVNSMKLIRAIVPDTVRAWQRRGPALTRVRGSAVTASRSTPRRDFNSFCTHSSEWWLGTELNRRHKDFQSSALPTELPSQPFICKRLYIARREEFDF